MSENFINITNLTNLHWKILGHNSNKRYFESVIKNGQLAHAYIFSGPEMVGKKMFACDLARLVNNRELNNDPDFKLVGPRIEDVRDLKSFLAQKPYFGPYQVAVIDNAEHLSAEASNAVLKTLEEPSQSAVIFLITLKPKLLLPTISSRCQEVKFRPLQASEMANFVASKLNAEDKKLLLFLAYGRPGWIIRNTDSIEQIKKSIKDFNQVLNQGIFEKIQYAGKIYDKNDLIEQIDNLIYWYYSQNQKQPKLLKNLLQLSSIISQPQHNHRLAIENFLINL